MSPCIHPLPPAGKECGCNESQYCDVCMPPERQEYLRKLMAGPPAVPAQPPLHDRKCNCGKPESQHTGKRKMCPNHGYTFSPAASTGDLDLGATCPDCHAPVGVGCVTIVWHATGDHFEPSYQPRHPHTRRRKRIAKFGPEASKRP